MTSEIPEREAAIRMEYALRSYALDLLALAYDLEVTHISTFVDTEGRDFASITAYVGEDRVAQWDEFLSAEESEDA